MARPSVPDSKYYEAFTDLISSGKKSEKITATDLQNAVGGRFDKARKLLEKYQSQFQNDQRQIPEQPDWFKQPLEKHFSDMRTILWNELYQKMQQDAEAIKQNAEGKINNFKEQNEELIQQLSLTENKMDSLSEENERLKKALAVDQGRRKQTEKLYEEANNRLLSKEKELGELECKLQIYATQVTVDTTK